MSEYFSDTIFDNTSNNVCPSPPFNRKLNHSLSQPSDQAPKTTMSEYIIWCHHAKIERNILILPVSQLAIIIGRWSRTSNLNGWSSKPSKSELWDPSVPCWHHQKWPTQGLDMKTKKKHIPIMFASEGISLSYYYKTLHQACNSVTSSKTSYQGFRLHQYSAFIAVIIPHDYCFLEVVTKLNGNQNAFGRLYPVFSRTLY